MPDSRQAIHYMDKIASRALGEQPTNDIDSVEPWGLVQHLDTADHHKDAGMRLSGRTRFARVKGLLLRFLRMYTAEQTAYNHAVLAALHTLNHNIESARVETDTRLARTQAAVSSSEMVATEAVDRLQATVSTFEEAVAALSDTVARLTDDRVADRSELAVQRARVELFLEEARRRLPEPFGEAQLRALTGDVESWLEPIYVQLEERFRGSRSHVRKLQEEYLADILALGPEGVVVDIGCGRGEWLELLRDNGIPAYGLDTNAGFVKRNLERGLDVRLEDAIEHLASVEEGSVSAITGFHLVEHLEFHAVVRLIDSALLALRPGGILVFETPNPTNLIVGSSSFYLDPTHRNPVHPDLLQFLVEARGFVQAEIRWLHPAQQVEFGNPAEPGAQQSFERLMDYLNWAFFGPMDYAVVARKAMA